MYLQAGTPGNWAASTAGQWSIASTNYAIGFSYNASSGAYDLKTYAGSGAWTDAGSGTLTAADVTSALTTVGDGTFQGYLNVAVAELDDYYGIYTSGNWTTMGGCIQTRYGF
jgi:hypothetical protein